MKVCIVGLGRIGLPTAVLCSRAGHDVVAVDRDDHVRDAITNGLLPYHEAGITAEDLASLELQPSVDGVEADVFILCVGTYSGGELDTDGLLRVAAELSPAGEPLVIVESTIPPGTCDKIRTMGFDLVAHCPERARPGDVLSDFATTPRLVGGIDADSVRQARAFYDTLTDAPLFDCTADEAALAKLAENAEREIRIAFANELADVSWGYGLEADRVAELANTHPRTFILRHGVGVGGLCLPMATRFFAKHGNGISERAREVHEHRPESVASRIALELGEASSICVLGRSYRANTRYDASLDGQYDSPAVALIAALEAHGVTVTSWDPVDADERTLTEALAEVDTYFVAVHHDEFDGLDEEKRVRVF